MLELLDKVNATHYLSGSAAKDYIEEKCFHDVCIELEWMDYSKYRECPQLYPPFEHGVSILDLVFNTGKDAINYIRVKNNRLINTILGDSATCTVLEIETPRLYSYFILKSREKCCDKIIIPACGFRF